MAVNTFATGMIVFRILNLKVTRVSKPTSVERALDSTGGTKFRHVMFVIIESGMALFAIQLVRVVLSIIPVPAVEDPYFTGAVNFVVVINQMLNVIIIISVYFLLLTYNIYLARESHQQ